MGLERTKTGAPVTVGRSAPDWYTRQDAEEKAAIEKSTPLLAKAVKGALRWAHYFGDMGRPEVYLRLVSFMGDHSQIAGGEMGGVTRDELEALSIVAGRERLWDPALDALKKELDASGIVLEGYRAESLYRRHEPTWPNRPNLYLKLTRPE